MQAAALAKSPLSPLAFRQMRYTDFMQEINNFLDSELVRRSSRWKALKRTLTRALPPEFLARVSYATLEEGKLTVFSDSPEWTSKMRFHSAEIIEVFESDGTPVTEVLARTVPKPMLRPPVEN